MTDSDNPSGNAGGNAPMTLSQGAERLAALFENGTAEPTTVEAQEAQEETSDDAANAGETEGSEDAETTENEADDEAEGTADEAEQDEQSAAPSLTDDTEIDLEDGTRTTLAELKKATKQVKEFQRDYTRKTDALKDDHAVVEQKAQAVLDRAQQLQQNFEFLAAAAQEFLPQPPQRPTVSPSEDPIAWVEYNAAKDWHEQRIQRLNEVAQRGQAQQKWLTEQQQAEMPKVLAAEREKLFARRPALKDPAIAQKTKAEMAQVISEKYGFSPDEIANVADSRAVEMMLDLLDYQRIKAAKPAAKANLVSKPPLVKSGKRQNPVPAAIKTREALRNDLRKTGSKQSAVALLKTLPL